MTFALRALSLAALAVIGISFAPAFAEDAMAPAADAMATDAMATDAMAPMMGDDDLKLCLEQAAMITFPAVMQVAADACHGMHNGMMGDAMAPKP